MRHARVLPGLLLFALSFGCGESNGQHTAEGLEAPIVLAHGFAGFDRVAGIMDYWFGIPEALEADGAEVHVTQVSPANSSLVRGEQLLAQIEEIASSSAAGRVHIIGHSQGGIDARYVMGLRPDLVASVTTVGTPHRLAEEFQVPTDPQALAVASAFMGALGNLISALSSNDQPNDPEGAISFFDAQAFEEFNARFPLGLPEDPCGEGAAQVDGILLYSWSGTAQRTNASDPLDLLFAATGSIFDEANDGLVERCSSHFGRVLRDDYAHNHTDEVNLLFGLVPDAEIHPIAIFRVHADRLRGVVREAEGLAVDSEGRFDPSSATLARFRTALADDQASRDTGAELEALRRAMQAELGGSAAREALELLDRFSALREASRSFTPTTDPESWHPAAFGARLEEVHALRAQHLGRAAAEHLFGDEERRQREAIARFEDRLQDPP